MIFQAKIIFWTKNEIVSQKTANIVKMGSITAIRLLFLNSAHSFTLDRLVLTPLLIFQAKLFLNQKWGVFLPKMAKTVYITSIRLLLSNSAHIFYISYAPLNFTRCLQLKRSLICTYNPNSLCLSCSLEKFCPFKHGGHAFQIQTQISLCAPSSVLKYVTLWLLLKLITIKKFKAKLNNFEMTGWIMNFITTV